MEIQNCKLEHGMFVAQVAGRSMEPLAHDGSYCLLRPAPSGSRQGRNLLVLNAVITDRETEGQWTLKIYSSEKVVREDVGWRDERIVLKPLNPAYQPLVLETDSQGEVSAIAELVRVIE